MSLLLAFTETISLQILTIRQKLPRHVFLQLIFGQDICVCTGNAIQCNGSGSSTSNYTSEAKLT